MKAFFTNFISSLLIIFFTSTSLFAAANSCDGDVISASVSGRLDAGNIDDYYQYSPGEGNVTISFTSDEPINFYVGSICDNDDYLSVVNQDIGTVDIELGAATIVYIHTDFKTLDTDYNIDIDFTPTSAAGSCLSYDNTPNSTDYIDIADLDTTNLAEIQANGDVIASMNDIDTNTTNCIYGDSASNDYDYYYFKVEADGLLNVTTTSPNNHEYYLKITTDSGYEYGTNTAEEHNIPTIGLHAGDSVYFRVKETGSDTDEYELHFNFILSDNISGDRNFIIRNPVETRNIRGDYVIGGNMNLCEDDGTGNCRANNGNSNSNDDIYINIDTSMINSSSFILDLPVNSTVVWAGLYWQGVVHRSRTEDGGDDFMGGTIPSDAPLLGGDTNQIDLTNETYDADIVKLKIPGANSYTEVEADELDFSKLGYGGFADVTSLLDLTNPNGTYTLADLKCHEGAEPNHGNYGAWALVVIYENINSDYTNITLFDGFATVDSSYSKDLELSGFLTPSEAPIESKIAFFTMDGEGGSGGTLTVISATGSKNVFDDPDNPADTLFNSTITGVQERVPDHPSLRLDLDIIDLVDYLGPLETSATLQPRSGGDRYTASFFIMSSELYLPEFCYDYTYKQNDTYFTEDNNGTQLPQLTGDVTTGEPVDMTIYLRSLISDVKVKNMYTDIVDINASQVSYIGDSIYVAKVGDLTPVHVADSSLDISTSDPQHIKNMFFGDVDTHDHFYIYYSLNPQMSSLETPIDVDMRYQIELNGETFDYTSRLGVEMKMCSGGTALYTPVNGIFNIVHDDYYNFDAGGANRLYNLPTQVTSREGNFKVISLDENDTDTLKNVSTIVAVELIDAGKFHYTDASCQELSNSISDRVWITIDDNATSAMFDQAAIQNAITNGMTGLTDGVADLKNSSDFYQNARQNTAFRISYNVTADGNESLVKIENGSKVDEFSINFTELVQDIGTCGKDMDGIPGNVDTVATWCGNNSDKLSTEDIAICMECIYGYNTKMVCSRDNFAIRPEAFSIKLRDQNQTTSALSTVHLDDDGLGVISDTINPTSRVLDIAAGYNYHIDINATNHLDHNSSPMYDKTLDIAAGDISNYIWEPRSITVANANSFCNDTVDKNISLSFQNGLLLDVNTSNDQAGEYRLSLVDKTWTSVDSNPIYMTHHTGAFYSNSNTPDCIADTSVTRVVNASDGSASPLIGCNISSEHNNSLNAAAGTNTRYSDYDLTFHPYAFNVDGITASLAKSNIPLNADSYIYMADMAFNSAQDENMSLHFNGNIDAVGENNITLTNFVDNCFAKPVSIDLNKTDTRGDLAYQYRFYNLNSNGSVARNINDDLNNTNTIAVNASDFQKDMNGSINTILNLNFERAIDVAANPDSITYENYDVNNTDLFKADLSNTKNAKGRLSVNSTIRHYYGRTYAPRARFKEDIDQQALIYYEVFCSGCDKTILQDGTSSTYTDDPRWLVNTQHINTLGTAGDINQKGYALNAGVVTQRTAPLGSHADLVRLDYDGTRGHPYKTTMENNASTWLIYNKYNAADTKNEFKVEFDGGASSWAGKHESNTTTDRTGTNTVNRRSMW